MSPIKPRILWRRHLAGGFSDFCTRQNHWQDAGATTHLGEFCSNEEYFEKVQKRFDRGPKARA
jgi:hypothetical protein